MARYNTESLLRDVRVIIAENEKLEPLINDPMINDQMALERDTLLKTLVSIAINKFHAIAPLDMIKSIGKDAENLSWSNANIDSQIAELPEDFLRLVYVRAKEWKKGVLDIVDEESATYKSFSSPLKGTRPNIYYPAAALVRSSFADGEGKSGNFVEVCPKSSNVVVNYVPMYDAEENSDNDGDGSNPLSVDKNDSYWCIVYTIANLYYVSVNDNARAEMMAKEAVDIIQGYKKQ